jgi:hypothetical protein
MRSSCRRAGRRTATVEFELASEPWKVIMFRDDQDAEGTGTTVLRYRTTGFPTLFVIDHDGTVVAQVGHYQYDRLETLVRELVEKAERR